MAVHDLARIEEKLDRVAVGSTAISEAIGGVTFQNMSEVIEFAKLMSLSGNAVPKHLQGNPGMCLAVCVQALEWRFSPFAVANKSYEVQQRLSFESQLIHAVIEQRAPITGRLRHKFEGEGDERRCIISATLRETGEALEYISPPFGKITPKNSPLWKSKPDLQLYYNTSRDFCRVYFPDVLLGVYTEDELRDHIGPDHAKDVSDRPSVASRLKGGKGRGFSQQHVERETRGVVDETQSEAQREAPAVVAAPAPSGDEPQASAEGPLSSGSGAVQDRCESTAPPVSPPEPLTPSGPDATPAPADPVPGAGTSSQSPSAASVEQSVPGGEEGQAGEQGNTAQREQPAGLPEDWRRQYAAALGAATKIGQLPRKATAFWEKHGGWGKFKTTTIRGPAEQIYDAYQNHFDNPEARDVILRELDAA